MAARKLQKRHRCGKGLDLFSLSIHFISSGVRVVVRLPFTRTRPPTSKGRLPTGPCPSRTHCWPLDGPMMGMADEIPDSGSRVERRRVVEGKGGGSTAMTDKRKGT